MSVPINGCCPRCGHPLSYISGVVSSEDTRFCNTCNWVPEAKPKKKVSQMTALLDAYRAFKDYGNDVQAATFARVILQIMPNLIRALDLLDWINRHASITVAWGATLNTSYAKMQAIRKLMKEMRDE